MIIFAAVLAVTERRNPNVSPWEVTERLEGSSPLGPCSQGVLSPCCLPEPRGAVIPAAGIVEFGSLRDPGCSGNVPVSLDAGSELQWWLQNL